MADVTIFHNPRCTKSRQAMEVLDDAGVEAEVVLYLKEPPLRANLDRIADKLEDPIEDLVRKDPKFKALGLDKSDYTTREAVIDLLVEHPYLMQRPLGEIDDVVIVGRPTERVTEMVG